MRFIFILILLLAVAPVQAGGAFIITESGAPSLWDNSSAIPYHPESGSCGSFSNSTMLTRIEDNLETWTSLSFVDLSFTAVTGTLTDINGSNYADVLVGVSGSNDNVSVNDGKNPVIFDDDGNIIAAVAGSANRFRVLGFANPAGFTSDYSEIVDGQAVINCRCVTGNPNGACTLGSTTVVFDDDETDFTIVHEFGHFLNLDHTQVNDDLADSDTSDDDDLPTMYPVSVTPAQQLTLHRDDIIALARLYPSSTFSNSTCRLTGTLLDSTGKELRCADVQAITSDVSDTVAFVSGAEAPAVDNNGDGDTVDTDECLADCGDFELYLQPGKAYTIVVRSINSSFTGGSGISPCAYGQLATIVDETIGSVSATECTAGGSLSFATAITTSSTGGVVPAGLPSSSSGGCMLLKSESRPKDMMVFMLVTGFLITGVFVLRAMKNKKVAEIRVRIRHEDNLS